MQKRLPSVFSWEPMFRWDPYREIHDMQKVFDDDLKDMENSMDERDAYHDPQYTKHIERRL